MRRLSHRIAGGSIVQIRCTERADGDFSIEQDEAVVDRRRRDIADPEWNWLRQVHGSRVVTADRPGQVCGAEADALITSEPDVPIAVQTADCAPVVIAAERAVAVVHVGWRGAIEGVLDATVARLGRGPKSAVLGPCIRPARYEFSEHDVAVVSTAVGRDVSGRTVDRRLALDLPAVVGALLDRHGIPLAATVGGCTASDPELAFSHRARRESARLATVAWLDAS